MLQAVERVTFLLMIQMPLRWSAQVRLRPARDAFSLRQSHCRVCASEERTVNTSSLWLPLRFLQTPTHSADGLFRTTSAPSE
ncbi:hypothetical protein H920_16642 [Fukomys damarensis]|uniref:Uncharacterized protein n=1 Tax=Fukomys damarensis TaxID=885580 RepID=A0A091CU33_FUKDA|nr:hypothetical protein H920_16642 [Fukomys damarensis]